MNYLLFYLEFATAMQFFVVVAFFPPFHGLFSVYPSCEAESTIQCVFGYSLSMCRVLFVSPLFHSHQLCRCRLIFVSVVFTFGPFFIALLPIQCFRLVFFLFLSVVSYRFLFNLKCFIVFCIRRHNFFSRAYFSF